jgi:hypothetical protein
MELADDRAAIFQSGAGGEEERMRAMKRTAIAWLALAYAASAQTGDFLRKSTFEERPALVISNNKLELTILTTGGSLANLLLADDPEKMSPFWNPVRMAREAGEGQRPGPAMGHFVCVDGFGPVSAEERAAGLPGHGEAHTVPWEVAFSGRVGGIATLVFSADLARVQEKFTRTFRLVDGENIIYVQSELESHLAFDRPVNWAEHATIGSPFLEPENTVLDLSGKRGKTLKHPVKQALPLRLASFQDFEWPNAPTADGKTVNLRAVPPGPNSLDHMTCLMDPSQRLAWVTAINTRTRLIIGYVFKREEYPWLQDWEFYPANLKMARGMEFGTQPFDVPRREAIGTGKMFETPTYRWLPAKGKIETRFLLFYARTPEGFRKVDDVKLQGGKLVLEDRQDGKQIALDASLPL